jgi:subtilisin family serine protease
MRFLIDFKQNITQQQVDDYFSQNACTLVKTYNAFDKVFLVDCDNTPPTNELIEFVVCDDDVELKAHEMHVGTAISNYDKSQTIVPTDEQWWMTYSIEGVEDITQPNISVPRRGKNVNVYLVDSGINNTHPEFANANIVLLHSFNNDFNDYNGHGTALASAIVGDKCGLADVNLKVVKIFQDGVPVRQSHLLDAFDAIYNDMTASNLMSIINMSWQIDKNPYVDSKVLALIAHGATCVVAAGNSGLPIGDVSPACVPGVIVVGSYNKNFQPSDFSQYTMDQLVSSSGTTNHGALSVWGPGENIYCADKNGGYRYVSGTSVAAAIHSAAVAYNFSFILNSSDEIPASMRQNGNAVARNWSNTWSIGKYKILDLSDPKYSNSVNYVTTYHIGQYDQDDNDFYTRSKINEATFDNALTGIILATPWVYDKAEVIEGSLPTGATIHNMFMEWTPNNICGEDNSKVFTFKLRLYTKDNKTFDSDVTLTVLNQKYTNIDLSQPTGDPTIDSFQLNALCDSAFFLAECFSSLCTAFSGTCKCCEDDPKAGICFVCICSNQACP